MTGQMHLDDAKVVTAPDGLQVRPLLVMRGGSMAEFRLPAGRTGRTIRHRTIEEIWQVTSGQGEVWRDGEVTALTTGTCISIPPGTAFQVRAGTEDLVVLAVTMPPWPGDDEAEVLSDTGPWVPSS